METDSATTTPSSRPPSATGSPRPTALSLEALLRSTTEPPLSRLQRRLLEMPQLGCPQGHRHRSQLPQDSSTASSAERARLERLDRSPSESAGTTRRMRCLEL